MTQKKSIRLIAIFCLFFISMTNYSFAQKNSSKTDPIKGIWQLTSFARQGEAASTRIHAFKVFDGYGNFYVVNTPDIQSPVITHQGKYKILSETEYTEEITEGMYKMDGKLGKLQYKIEENGNKLFLIFQIGNHIFEETWVKVQFAS